MARWSLKEPTELTFDALDAVKVAVVGGHVAVLATDGPPKLEVSSLREPPLTVTHEGGRLTISYEDWTWEGLLRWVHCSRRAATVTLAVPRDCRVNLGTVSAGALVAGMEAATSIRTVSGEVALNGLTEKVDVHTVSGDVEAEALGGVLDVNSVSGSVTLSSDPCHQLRAKTVSGKIITDLGLVPGATANLTSMSGDITVRLPRNADATVDLRSMSGRVGSAFTGVTRARNPGSRAAHGTLGDGSAAFAATTVSGDIALLRRDFTETMAAEGAV